MLGVAVGFKEDTLTTTGKSDIVNNLNNERSYMAKSRGLTVEAPTMENTRYKYLSEKIVSAKSLNEIYQSTPFKYIPTSDITKFSKQLLPFSHV